jgi:AraC family transcriptional regulator
MPHAAIAANFSFTHPHAQELLLDDLTTRYLARFHKVIAYIDSHMDVTLSDDSLSVDRLSEVAAFSKYHFHRQFTALFGLSAYRYLQLLRLKRAAHQLAFRHAMSITDIALISGYESSEAFARAFRKTIGQSPSEFRQRPQWRMLNEIYQPFDAMRFKHMAKSFQQNQVTVVTVKPITVATLEHRGDPQLIGETIARFIAWRKQNQLPPRLSATFNIWYDNPNDVAPDAFRLDLCAATDKPISANEYGVVQKIIPGGRCAVLRHVGTDANIEQTALYLYSQWLPQSGEEARDFPMYVQRISFFPDVPEHEAVTDIFLPLK